MSKYCAQCSNCIHFQDESDESVGLYGNVYCDAVEYDNEEVDESIIEMFEQIMFARAAMNECPRFKSITALKIAV